MNDLIDSFLALDGSKLSLYRNERMRSQVMTDWLPQLEESNDADRDEVGILESGDLNRVFGYIESHLPKPAGGDQRGWGT